jgi:hypothetical protein
MDNSRSRFHDAVNELERGVYWNLNILHQRDHTITTLESDLDQEKARAGPNLSILQQRDHTIRMLQLELNEKKVRTRPIRSRGAQIDPK